jgi:hypothetical protein
MKLTVFRDVAPCSLVEVYRRFRGAYCLHHQSLIALMMEAVNTVMNLRIKKEQRISRVAERLLAYQEVPYNTVIVS